MYINDGMVYISYDPGGVQVWKDSTDTLILQDYWTRPAGSPQGIHVRGSYGYVAPETLDLWIHDISTSTDYIVAGPDICQDVYNVGFTDSNASLTYSATQTHLRVWDTTDPQDVELVGSVGYGGPLYQVVHVTGDWVYRLGDNKRVEVYPLEYDDPDLHTGYTAPETIYDVHVVHERYMGGPINPIFGTAHIFGVYKDSDTVAIWVHSPSSITQRVDGYKYGDVDEDGDVDVADALLLSYYTNRGYNSVIENLDAADVNCDGEVNSCDYDYLTEYLWNNGPDPGADCDFYHDW